jgi:hypothetical protein
LLLLLLLLLLLPSTCDGFLSTESPSPALSWLSCMRRLSFSSCIVCSVATASMTSGMDACSLSGVCAADEAGECAMALARLGVALDIATDAGDEAAGVEGAPRVGVPGGVSILR